MMWNEFSANQADNVLFIRPVEVSTLTEWVSKIPFTHWPQSHLDKGRLRPAMISDTSWYDFGKMTDGVVDEVMKSFPGCQWFQRMLSVVMPEQEIAPHTDGQNPDWLTRVHIPLVSNPVSKFIVSEKEHVLSVGSAYGVDTRAVHSVVNQGKTPRVHFMFDIRR